jgi:hypothetical protein
MIAAKAAAKRKEEAAAKEAAKDAKINSTAMSHAKMKLTQMLREAASTSETASNIGPTELAPNSPGSGSRRPSADVSAARGFGSPAPAQPRRGSRGGSSGSSKSTSNTAKIASPDGRGSGFGASTASGSFNRVPPSGGKMATTASRPASSSSSSSAKGPTMASRSAPTVKTLSKCEAMATRPPLRVAKTKSIVGFTARKSEPEENNTSDENSPYSGEDEETREIDYTMTPEKRAVVREVLSKSGLSLEGIEVWQDRTEAMLRDVKTIQEMITRTICVTAYSHEYGQSQGPRSCPLCAQCEKHDLERSCTLCAFKSGVCSVKTCGKVVRLSTLQNSPQAVAVCLALYVCRPLQRQLMDLETDEQDAVDKQLRFMIRAYFA